MRRIRPQSANNRDNQTIIRRTSHLDKNSDLGNSDIKKQEYQRDYEKIKEISLTASFSLYKKNKNMKEQNNSNKKRSKTRLIKKNKINEDNNPMYQYKTVKQIAIISAYDPNRLKNVTIKKRGISDFFVKYKPDDNILGKMFMKPTINNFKEWKKKIVRKYDTVFQQFCQANDLDDMERIGQQLKSISGQSYLMIDLIETLLNTHESHEIRSLAQKFKQLLLQSIEFNSALSVQFECKLRLLTIIRNFQNQSMSQQRITSFADKKTNQVKNAFDDHHNTNQFQNQIIQKISNFINKMVWDLKIINMQNIMDRIKKSLQQYHGNGLKGLIQINKIAKQLLDFFDKIQSLQKPTDDTIISDQLKNKLNQYKNEATRNKKNVIQMLITILKQIIEEFQRDRLNKNIRMITIQSKKFHLTQFQNVLRYSADNLLRAKIENAKDLKQLFKQVNTLISNFKKYRKNIINLAKRFKQENKSIDNFQIPQLEQLLTNTKTYKQNIFEINHIFQKAKNILKKKSQLQIQQNSLEKDMQLIDLNRLKEDISNFNIKQYISLSCFQHTSSLSFLNENQFKEVDRQLIKGINQTQTIFNQKKKIQQNYNKFTNIFGYLNYNSDILKDINILDDIIKIQFNKERIKQSHKKCEELSKKFKFNSNQQKQSIYNFITKLLYIRLYPLVKGSDINNYHNQGSNKENMSEKDIKDLRQLLKHLQKIQQLFKYDNTLDVVEALKEAKDKLQDIKGYQFNNSTIETNAQSFQKVSNAFYDLSLNIVEKYQFVNDFVSILKKDITRLQKMTKNSLQNGKKEIQQIRQILKDVEKNIIEILKFGKQNKIKQGIEEYSKFINNGYEFLKKIKQPFSVVIAENNQKIYLSNKRQFDQIFLMFLQFCQLKTTNRKLLHKLKDQWEQIKQTQFSNTSESTEIKRNSDNFNNQQITNGQQMQNLTQKNSVNSNTNLKTPEKKISNSQNRCFNIKIKFNFIPSLSKLFNSIISLQQFKDSYEQKVQKQKIIIMKNINSIYSYKFHYSQSFSSSSSSDSIKKLINDSKDIITNIQNYISTFLQNNIFKQFLQNQQPFNKIILFLKTLLVKLDISQDKLTPQDLSQLQEAISKSVSSYIIRRKSLIAYQSINDTIKLQYIQTILKQIKTQFAPQQINIIIPNYMKDTQKEKQYQCKQNFDQLNIIKNNQILQEFNNQIIVDYDKEELKYIFQKMVQCKINKSQENIQQYERKVQEFLNKINSEAQEKINTLNNNINKLVIRFSGLIKQKFQKLKLQLEKKNKDIQKVLRMNRDQIGKNIETILQELFKKSIFQKRQLEKNQIQQIIKNKMLDYERKLSDDQRKKKEAQDQRKKKEAQDQLKRRQKLRLQHILKNPYQIETQPAINEDNQIELSIVLSEGIRSQIFQNIKNASKF